ncbi:hypothetical protein AGMMS49546_03800 [Spirochaetia bacterium]|nr:hypothetical protein AGMMS49546_03800 [Spirochaetia bacterium]
MSRPAILVAPCVEKGRGGGHLVRSAALIRNLRSRSREAFLYVPDSILPGVAGGVPHLSPFLEDLDPRWFISGREAVAEKHWAFIVLDRFRTPAEEYRFWSSLAPLIGIDEGGPCRNDFDFLIDLLPGPSDQSRPNILAPALLPLPKNRRSHFWEADFLQNSLAQSAALRAAAGPDAAEPSEVQPLKEPEPEGQPRVLISFGAEDLAGLGKRCRALLSGQPLELTFLDPAQGQSIPNLREHLAEYDLIITHFGLTAFEAVYAGVPVLLVSPGAYHEKLAKTAGFISAGIGKRGCRRVRRLLSDRAFPEKLRESCRRIAEKYGFFKALGQNLAGLLEEADPMVSRAGNSPEETDPRLSHAGGSPETGTGIPVCPACGAGAAAGPHRTLARFPDRSYRRCPRCGMVYMNRLNPPPIEYEKEYFFDFYKKQYGKTYIEDFPNLINMGKKRLALIKSLLARTGSGPGRLLDIGCAYGPFLQAAREAGFEVAGIDPAEDAVAYVQKELNIPAFRGFFPDTGLPDILRDSAFSAVTLWYVIEHFRSPGAALEACRRILRGGGVLAFSTPSFQGVSGRKSPLNFLQNSPADHWTVWSPRRCKKLLKKEGFTLKKIVISGHHPERFPLIGKFLGQKRGPAYQCGLLLSRLFGLGDTFEVYAIKTQ